MNLISLSQTLNLLKKLFLIHVIFLCFMSIFRLVFFLYYSELDSFNSFLFDIIKAFFLGFRVDLTVIGFIQVIPTLALIFLYYLKKESFFKFFNSFLIYYIFICYLIVTILLCADFGFYSYFKDHINVLFFGLFEDDTVALLETFWENYNVFSIFGIFFIYLIILFFLIKNIFSKKSKEISSFFGLKNPWLIFLILLVFNFLIIRGTLGMYPLGKMIPNVSTNEYINKISQNGVRAFITAYGIRKDYKAKKVDYIKETGFENKIEEAFEIHKKNQNIDKTNLLNNITYSTKKVDNEDYNVVVIMVESFGMPILKYQNEEFNILGELKKHFDEDVLFSNIISEGDGTISSLESLLLNIPYRPNSFPFSQSEYAQTNFTFSPAFLYKDSGYETTFIYGGDLTWRDLGNFVKFQGYKNVEGKQDIFNSLEITKSKDEYFHPWGIFDEYLYKHILEKLENSKQKEFIVALSTNNHPPYNVPNDYISKSLIYSENLKNHITGDFNLAQQRFKSYAYALDSLGKFLDEFKRSRFKDNTIIVITADNNTVEGIMKYDDNPTFTSKNIPIYFYLPKKLKDKMKTVDTTVAGSQKDIFPTLYNLTLDSKNYISIGSNLFDIMLPHYGFNGSMIVNHNSNAKKLDKLNQKTDDEMLNYYKATLAVTQYLIDNSSKKDK
ncbi:LTA synthase family protein [Aliarcobacter butzleri]|uniref:LTA synthase family protein n=1 Tax=Aliarcobacter butzleri TaxID=28197 RepID=UPI003AF9FBA1